MNKAFLAAYNKGRTAFEKMGDLAVCPYADKRGNYRNNTTFSRAFQNYWHEGFQDKKNKLSNRYST